MCTCPVANTFIALSVISELIQFFFCPILLIVSFSADSNLEWFSKKNLFWQIRNINLAQQISPIFTYYFGRQIRGLSKLQQLISENLVIRIQAFPINFIFGIQQFERKAAHNLL